MKIASQSPTTLNGTSPWTRLFRRSILLMASVSKTTEPYSITSFSSFETHHILAPINELLQPDPVEIVTPVVKADSTWRTTIDQFWSIIRKHFDLRRDTSCGMHIHVSPVQSRFDIGQLRCIAKAVVLWERDTARCAPPSRDDRVQNFCLSNVLGAVPAARSIQAHGPLRGLRHAFRHIDHASRNDIVDYVCPDKHRVWNFLSARETGHGSVEFRRPPGVTTGKKAKHWIAFTMAFIDMALRSNLDRVARRLSKHSLRHRRADKTSGSSLNFEDLLLASAEHLGVYCNLDPRLHQLDEPRSLHITMMRPNQINWLQRFDDDYHLSASA